MAYTIIVDGKKYLGYTIPAASPMRIAESTSQQLTDPFLADFIPDGDTLLSDHPTGRWDSIQPGVSQALLDKLKPAVLATCRRRRLNILKVNLQLPKDDNPEWLASAGDEVLKVSMAVR